MVAVRITPDMEMAIVGTPEHFRRYGFPQTPADLKAHPCIAYQFADGSVYQWELNQDDKKSLIALKGNGPHPTAIWKQKPPGWASDWPMFLLNWSRMI